MVAEANVKRERARAAKRAVDICECSIARAKQQWRSRASDSERMKLERSTYALISSSCSRFVAPGIAPIDRARYDICDNESVRGAYRP